VPNIVRLSRVARLAARRVFSVQFLWFAAIVTLGTDCASIKARQVNRRAVKAQRPPKDNPKPRKGVGSVVGAFSFFWNLGRFSALLFMDSHASPN
jgi:hypothetical protein